MNKDSYCSFCGSQFSEDQVYPKDCSDCHNITYVNPKPVAAVLLPIINEDRVGILTIRRAIPPFIGSLALPGGYVDVGETWQQGAARELFEETGIVVDSQSIYEWGLETVANGNLLIFCGTEPMDIKNLSPFVPNSEVSEMLITYEPIELAFPTHTKYLKMYFDYKDI